MFNALTRDWFVRLTLLLWVAVMVLYAAPIVPPSWPEFYGEWILDLPFFWLVALAAFAGLGRVADEHERRFWRLLGLSFLILIVIGTVHAIVPEVYWTIRWDLAVDVGYLLSYLALILAIEGRPHEQHSGTVSERERRLRTTGVTLLGFFLLTYFVLISITYRPEVYETGKPSHYMFLLFDAVIVMRLLWLRRETWSVRWSTIYAWLAGAAALAFSADVVEALSLSEIIELPNGGVADHLWLVGPVLWAIAIRGRHVPFTAEQRVLNETASARLTFRAGHILMLGAFALPFLHYALYAAGLFTDPGARALREVVAMASMVTLGGLALVAYRVLERDREQMEEKELRLLNELGVARKMDAVARLAGSVAHDFNNLVQVVRGRAEIIGQQIARDNPLHEDVREIRAAAARAADLASQLMTFGRKQPSALVSVSLHDVLKRAERLLKPVVIETIRLQFRLKAAADVVHIDPLQFERIILNLAMNARDAMPDGGALTIETVNPSLDAFAGPYADTSRIQMIVRDTGVGMEPETINHIFEPFFTTKDQRGAGLGLAIVHGLVQQFGGSISVESTPGAGTVFTITLPVVEDAPASVTTSPRDAGDPNTPSAVLIVEGDTTSRQLLRRLLTDLDRPILATATAAEAILVAERYSGPIGLAVIDVTIENGRTLGRRLRETQANLKVLLLAQDHPVDLIEGDELLREPFELSEVLEAARRLVITPSAGA